MTFVLHPRLEADTAFIADWPLCRVLLMDDARFPWLILVPRRANITEIHNLIEQDRTVLMHEISRASQFLRCWAEVRGGCDKMNIAAIGNLVPQLHVHVVARTRTDSAWPYPMWGRGDTVRYSPDELQRRAKELAGVLGQ